MANEVVNLKYKLPKLTFKVKPSTSQTYTVYYRIYESSADDSREWLTLTSNYQVDVNGNCTNTSNSDYVLSNLASNIQYQLKFSNNINSSIEYICTFKTGTSITMSDSPYYNKVLFPGQTFDWYIDGMDTLGQPTKSEVNWYFKLNSHKSEVLFAAGEVWNSMVTLPIGNDDSWATKSDTTTDGLSTFNSQQGYYINNGTYISLPNITGTGSTVEYDMDGGITAFGVLNAYVFNIGFGFYIDELDATNGTTLCNVDNTGYVDAGTQAFKYRLFVDGTGRICTSRTINTTTTTSNDTTLTIAAKKWYYVWPNDNGSSFRIYTITKASESADISAVTLVGTAAGQTITVSEAQLNGSSKKTPFCFGDANTNGLTINNIVGAPSTNVFLIKVINPSHFGPRLHFTFTLDNTEYTYTQKTNLTSGVESDKCSFIIDPDIWAVVTPLSTYGTSTVGTVKCDIYNDSDRVTTDLTQKVFTGFTLTDTINSTTTVIGGLVKNSDFQESSFDLQFGDSTTAFNGLKQHFFPKHGTWGGFNGGTSGNNMYLDGYNNLILEAHGDRYSGTVKGVLKESLAATYTGYGPDNDLGFSWDTRTNKKCLRTGSCLVSNKYFSYGEISVWMRLPVGLYGVCPALWFEHYIEIPETDIRYDKVPYKTLDIQDDGSGGKYKVMNNEIDIELPSHVTQGVFSNWTTVTSSYFDTNALDTKYMIGVSGTSSTDAGTFVLTNISAPNERASWTQYSQNILKRYQPSFTNCKLNNWIGELNKGNGWGASSAAYTGKLDGTDTSKEEYLALLTHLCSGTNGYADGQWHKWTIKWLPTETVLYIDDVKIRENKAFVPTNQMKFILAMWFPTMLAAIKDATTGEITKTKPKTLSNATGILDSDSIYGLSNNYIEAISDANPIGTWAGNHANFDIAKLIINRISYTKYSAGDVVEGHTITSAEMNALGVLGESYPESGLRIITV